MYPIAMSVMVAHLFLLPIDGCSINPSRSFGPSLVAAMAGIGGRYYHQQYMFWFGPLFGAGVAACLYEYCGVKPKRRDNKEDMVSALYLANVKRGELVTYDDDDDDADVGAVNVVISSISNDSDSMAKITYDEVPPNETDHEEDEKADLEAADTREILRLQEERERAAELQAENHRQEKLRLEAQAAANRKVLEEQERQERVKIEAEARERARVVAEQQEKLRVEAEQMEKEKNIEKEKEKERERERMASLIATTSTVTGPSQSVPASVSLPLNHALAEKDIEAFQIDGRPEGVLAVGTLSAFEVSAEHVQSLGGELVAKVASNTVFPVPAAVMDADSNDLLIDALGQRVASGKLKIKFQILIRGASNNKFERRNYGPKLICFASPDGSVIVSQVIEVLPEEAVRPSRRYEVFDALTNKPITEPILLEMISADDEDMTHVAKGEGFVVLPSCDEGCWIMHPSAEGYDDNRQMFMVRSLLCPQ